MKNDDNNLRDRFQLLKSQDRALAPEFTRQPELRGRWVPNYRFAGSALTLILLAAFGVKSFLHRPERAEVSIAQISHWRAPTDSLLETPGGELLRTLPQFGENLQTSEIK